MAALSTAYQVLRKGDWSGPAEPCALTYSERFLRRKKLVTQKGTAFLVDLAQTTSLEDGDALRLEDGDLIAIKAAPEEVLRIKGNDLTRWAWHIGNRHTPCQIESDYLVIQADPVIAHMLQHLGATVSPMEAAFTPEGGAYGQGRTHGHAHGATAHEH